MGSQRTNVGILHGLNTRFFSNKDELKLLPVMKPRSKERLGHEGHKERMGHEGHKERVRSRFMKYYIPSVESKRERESLAPKHLNIVTRLSVETYNMNYTTTVYNMRTYFLF